MEVSNDWLYLLCHVPLRWKLGCDNLGILNHQFHSVMIITKKQFVIKNTKTNIALNCHDCSNEASALYFLVKKVLRA